MSAARRSRPDLHAADTARPARPARSPEPWSSGREGP